MTGTWPADPRGDMEPILRASVEAAKMRHPSAARTSWDNLNATDRCDACGAAAVYRVERERLEQPEGYAQPYINVSALEFCGHHWRKHFPAMAGDGWTVVATNPALVGPENRLQGSDH
ncbi:DUF7455 domain-containing protein [Streptomyces hydrogenans]|uniref:DUF7455 domain-containing protein n=1 Tax=Streptomyces hydrogenans TaxID=1873719 RepID=A0ABQ3PJD1_9ACTN|nr:hypothetical protein [Streptomyces hydrogenans]GHF94409.1 hypothetical protein GCM10018784_02600 [Streptomyces hydrogenans]GHI25134.1 hypothetical protein Shyd_65050 [Streptomyces hydrogenans]